mgnify:CR=1 FL=1
MVMMNFVLDLSIAHEKSSKAHLSFGLVMSVQEQDQAFDDETSFFVQRNGIAFDGQSVVGVVSAVAVGQPFVEVGHV